mmetsp:Transcript_52118/g.138878  ORF Transcript_52118/g.138878 Transcript_52118/m.138878 type:complete len:287 (-) Transcript_52118:1986-2846(-)
MMVFAGSHPSVSSDEKAENAYRCFSVGARLITYVTGNDVHQHRRDATLSHMFQYGFVREDLLGDFGVLIVHERWHRHDGCERRYRLCKEQMEGGAESDQQQGEAKNWPEVQSPHPRLAQEPGGTPADEEHHVVENETHGPLSLCEPAWSQILTYLIVTLEVVCDLVDHASHEHEECYHHDREEGHDANVSHMEGAVQDREKEESYNDRDPHLRAELEERVHTASHVHSEVQPERKILPNGQLSVTKSFHQDGVVRSRANEEGSHQLIVTFFTADMPSSRRCGKFPL